MKIFSLFSGIGGFEYGFRRIESECVGFCEIDNAARSVLSQRFPGVSVHSDVTKLKSIPEVDIVTAGFPCQDLSQAGLKHGLSGSQSSLVEHIFRLLSQKRSAPRLVILENVSYMLRLHKGDSVRYIVSRAEELGYKWAYRVLDARSFGLPQRRERVVFILSGDVNPEDILFPSGYIEPAIDDSVGHIDPSCLYGFYWTEGKRGLGWTRDGVPTIKGGSTIGIPSPPAIWDPKSGKFGTPSLRDAERLFGFPADWTKPAIAETRREGTQWKLIGNSICVPMVEWIASQVCSPKGLTAKADELEPNERMPMAAFGHKGKGWSVQVSTWARRVQSPKLRTFLKDPTRPLSEKAARGFYKRALETRVIRFPDGFLGSLNAYIQETGRSG